MVMNREITKWMPDPSITPSEPGELPQEVEVVDVNCNHDIHFTDAIEIGKLPAESIDLVVTSPPYWTIKDYGRDEQLGYNDSLAEYMEKLVSIFGACLRALKPESKLCINIGDQFHRADTLPKRVYQITPLHAMLVNNLLTQFYDDLVYLGTINWNKVTTSHTSGGGQIMGSYPYPKSGYFFVNREYIAIFRKLGKEQKNHKPRPEYRQASRLTLDEWRLFFKDTWQFQPDTQESHIAVFPEELPRRLIKMYSFVGDTVLDPFLGSGTTSRVAGLLGRSSKGYEIGFETKNGVPWKDLIRNKVEVGPQELQFSLEEKDDERNKISRPGVLRVRNAYNYF